MTATLDGTNGLVLDAAGQPITNVNAINGGQLAGMRNKIINGDMNIAQRGTSFAGIANAAYSLDRWLCGYVTSAVATITQQADAPSNNEFQNSLRVAVTTADASIASGDLFQVQQRIEGYNARDLIGKTFALSFWVRSSKTGTHCVAFANGGGTPDRSYVAEYTVNAANTWEQKSITVSGGLITAGTWNWTNGIGLIVSWTLAAGSTFQTSANAWQTGNYFATSSQVNCLDTIGNIFAITGVQLEVGSVATPFEHRPIGTELALCQRYYFFGGSNTPRPQLGTAGQGWGWFTFPVTMRTSPTVTISGSWRQLPGGAGVTTPSVSEYSAVGFSWFTSNVTALIQGADTGSPFFAVASEL